MLTLKVLHALRFAGLLGWGLLLLALMVRAPEPSWTGVSPFISAVAGGAVYLLAFWQATDPLRPRPIRLRWTLVLSGAALLLNGLFASHSLADALLVAVAAILPMQLDLLPASMWVGGQAALLFLALQPRLGALEALRAALWSLGLQGALVLGMWFVFHHLHTRREWFSLAARIRVETERQAREAERKRIARDLHDLLGHDLALLGLELESARHDPESALSAVFRARTIASRLCDDVRGTVSELRHAPRGWGEVTRPLGASIPGLHIHLALPPSTPVPEGAAALALARVVQEALTNTVRHAGATNFFVQVCQERGEVLVRLWDDGKARGPITPGNGLKGMRERLEAVGGALSVSTQPTGSVCLHVRVPVPEDAP